MRYLRACLLFVVMMAHGGVASVAEEADQSRGKVVLRCKGTVTVADQASPEESGVILDFGKRLVFHRGAAYNMVNVTDTTIAFDTREEDLAKGSAMRFVGYLDRITGAFTLTEMPQLNDMKPSRWIETLQCVPGERQF
jgi:hypothetical protein